MSEKKYCEVCPTTSEICYMKKCEEINRVANEHFDLKNLGKAEKIDNASGIEQMISQLRNDARIDHCIHPNEIVSTHKLLKDL